MNINKSLIEFLNKSGSQFQIIENLSDILNQHGFSYLKECDHWALTAGKYYTVRNNSSIIAFEIPSHLSDYHFQICASHSDSPTYKVKANAELNGPGEYLRLNVESYGGVIDSTWLDRPLSVAGRIIVRKGNTAVSQNLSINKDILLIPNLPIHFNKNVNEGYKFNRQIDLCPLFSNGQMKKGDFVKMIAKEAKVKPEDILGYDLFLVNRTEGRVWGYKNEFISSKKLDDSESAYCSLLGFVDSKENNCIKVYGCFDNEEVGSVTKQGAMSTFMRDTLERINNNLGYTAEDFCRASAKSFMVSFDNAHAVHPNHPEIFDQENRCYMNKGIVIKENASQKYTTDSFSRSVFKAVCDKANVPVQFFANRSDLAGGNTLGNLSNTQVSMHAVDIGLAQLAMHSSYETAGAKDSEYAYQALKAYYSSNIQIEDALNFRIED